MKRKRHTEEQIIAILKEHEAGSEDGRSVPQARDQRGKLLQLEGQVWRAGSLRGQASEGTGERERQAEEAAGRRHARQRGAEGPAGKKMVTPAAKREAVAHLRSCVRHERAAGVQDDRLRADDGAVSVAQAGRCANCGSGCGPWRMSAAGSAIDGCMFCCDGRASW